MAPVLEAKSIGSTQKTVIKGKFLNWGTKNQAKDPGTLQLNNAICLHDSKLVPRKLDPAPSSKVGVMVFYCKTLLTDVENHNQAGKRISKGQHLLLIVQ
jgi:hypothetical protein